MQAKFWNFAKRENSLKLPPAGATWAPDINLKAETSLYSPSLILGSERPASEIWQYNYCQLETGQYYFIDDWTSARGDLWVARCTMDLLATYRAQILNTTAFVEYDTTGNSEVVDFRLSTVTTASYKESTASFRPYYSSGGCYVVTVTGRGGSVASYALSDASLSDLLNSVSSWAGEVFDGVELEWQAIATLGKQLISVGSAAENIRSCVWCPWPESELIGSSKTIYLGNYDTGVTGLSITVNVQTNLYDISIPWQFGDWRNSSYCTNISLYLPYVGAVALDANALTGLTSIRVIQGTDVRTGNIAYTICSPDEQKIFGAYGGCAGGSVPVGVSNVSPSAIVNAVSNVADSVLSGGRGLAGTLAQEATNMLTPNVTCVGGISSAAGSGTVPHQIILFTTCRGTNVGPSSVSAAMGTPAMAVKTLSGLSGFVKCRGASVSANAGQSQLAKINAYLNGGVFIE